MQRTSKKRPDPTIATGQPGKDWLPKPGRFMRCDLVKMSYSPSALQSGDAREGGSLCNLQGMHKSGGGVIEGGRKGKRAEKDGDDARFKTLAYWVECQAVQFLELRIEQQRVGVAGDALLISNTRTDARFKTLAYWVECQAVQFLELRIEQQRVEGSEIARTRTTDLLRRKLMFYTRATAPPYCLAEVVQRSPSLSMLFFRRYQVRANDCPECIYLLDFIPDKFGRCPAETGVLESPNRLMCGNTHNG
ncbi:hypothetical protein EGW08_009272 [Elysia chlorotica]|uniref:Uncharacterized protein n=1 Tax=Elysia chlorotica TaxID=188477 RepID=A0A433TN25_ELYCH|nr:hypothetical protein EGW08_009272 [Elysia chlorotica]